jgi:hypothetical protein
MRPLNLPPASHGAWHLLAEMQKPADPPLRVDGIVAPVVNANEVLRLVRRSLDAPAIAERLQVSVLEIESVLRRFATALSWESLRLSR